MNSSTCACHLGPDAEITHWTGGARSLRRTGNRADKTVGTSAVGKERTVYGADGSLGALSFGCAIAEEIGWTRGTHGIDRVGTVRNNILTWRTRFAL